MDLKFLSMKKSLQNKESAYTAGQYSRIAPYSDQPVEWYSKQSICITNCSSINISNLNSCFVNIFNKLIQRLLQIIKLQHKLRIILTQYHTPFRTADALMVSTNRNVTAPRSVRQLQHVFLPLRLLSSSLFSRRFGRYALRPSSSVCRERSQNFELRYWIHGGHLFWFR